MQVQRRRSALVTLLGSSAVTVIAALQALVLLPLYLDVLGPRLYGAWLATGEAIVWMLAFDFGIPNLLIQRTGAALARGEKESIGRLFGTSVLALLVLSLIVCGSVWVLSPSMASLFGGGVELTLALRVGVFAVGATLIGYAFVGLSRGLQQTSFVQGFALAGTVLSFVLTAWMLLNGFGLEALAYGLVVRGVTTLVGGVLFVVFRVDRSVTRAVRPSKDALRDIVKHCPPMFVAGISYALMNNSSITLAALMFRPEVAAVLGVTRKAADLIRGVLDMIGHSAYGGLSHLFAQGDRERSARVYRELGATFSLVAIASLSGFVAVNGALIEAWVGREMYGGFGLTVALAASAALGPWAYMQISVWRSLGRHNEASGLLLGACAVRLLAMFGLASAVGLVGLPIASALAALAMGMWASRKAWREIGSMPQSIWIVRLVPMACALSIGLLFEVRGWAATLVVGSLMVSFSAVWLLMTDSALSHYRSAVLQRGVA